MDCSLAAGIAVSNSLGGFMPEGNQLLLKETDALGQIITLVNCCLSLQQCTS
jgi:hypothetical protein